MNAGALGKIEIAVSIDTIAIPVHKAVSWQTQRWSFSVQVYAYLLYTSPLIHLHAHTVSIHSGEPVNTIALQCTLILLM